MFWAFGLLVVLGGGWFGRELSRAGRDYMRLYRQERARLERRRR